MRGNLTFLTDCRICITWYNVLNLPEASICSQTFYTLHGPLFNGVLYSLCLSSVLCTKICIRNFHVLSLFKSLIRKLLQYGGCIPVCDG